MSLETIFSWLADLGKIAGSGISLPAGIQIPSWLIGLILILAAALILKVVTHVIFRVVLIALMVVLIVFLLSSLGLPILQWLGLVGSK
jgi:hypothetical protein